MCSIICINSRYTFKTYDNDIGFGVTRNDSSSKKPISVLENKRYNSHMVPEDGEVILEQPGTCKIINCYYFQGAFYRESFYVIAAFV